MKKMAVAASRQGEFKNTIKMFLQKPKSPCRKKNESFRVFFSDGSSKTRLKKYRKNKSDPSPFSYSDPPKKIGGCTTGATDLFFAGPLRGRVC
jgi:hypothetical protein